MSARTRQALVAAALPRLMVAEEVARQTAVVAAIRRMGAGAVDRPIPEAVAALLMEARREAVTLPILDPAVAVTATEKGAKS